jgi:PAS domain S-box-containing protein
VDPNLSGITVPEFLDQIGDGVLITDAERRIAFWNKAAEDLMGFSREELVGRKSLDRDVLSCRTLFGREAEDRDRGNLLSLLLERPSSIPPIILVDGKSGKGIPVAVGTGPIVDRAGNTAGSFAVLHDMRDEYRQRKLALEIQKRAITQGDFFRNGVRVRTLYNPVEEIGGDFLEAFFLDDGSLIATVADATGHGMSASLFAMVYKTLLHSAFSRCRTPAEVLTDLNKGFLRLSGIEGYYMSACVVRLDPRTGSGSYAAAGHPEGLVFVKEGKGLALRRKLHIVSFMLGIEEDTLFEEMDFSLEPAESLLLASDGLFESECFNGKAFGVPGVERFFHAPLGPNPLEELLQAVQKESKYMRLPDDVSMLEISLEKAE